MEYNRDWVRGWDGHRGEDNEVTVAAGAVYEGQIRGGRKRKRWVVTHVTVMQNFSLTGQESKSLFQKYYIKLYRPKNCSSVYLRKNASYVLI